MTKPFVSIVTVCYNSKNTLGKTIQSVAQQSSKDFEYILIDGGSTDGTLEIIEQNIEVISSWISEPDSGIYEAMNKGLNMANGEYIIYLNADDCFANENVISFIAAQIGNNTALGMSVEIYKGEQLKRKYSSTHFKPWMFRFGHQPPHPGFICNTDFLKELNGFNESFQIAGDFDLFLRCFKHQDFKWKSYEEVSIKMQTGGASDGGVKQKQVMNREILQSLRNNEIYSNILFIWSKYLIKIFQFL